MTTEIVRATPAAMAVPTLDSQIRFAQLLSDADLLPRQFVGKPANVLYAIEYGRTLGIAPVAAITGIHVIEGKPSASSGLIGALVRQAGHKLRVKSDGGTTATAEIVRADDPGFTYSCTWTLERAQQAGLCKVEKGLPVARDRNGKPTSWEKYPAAMLKARAITEVARDACEDVLFGLHYTPEELGATVDQDGNIVEATVQQLRSVPAADDQWATPSPSPQAQASDATVTPEPHQPAQELADHGATAKDKARIKQLWALGKNGRLHDAPVRAEDTGEMDLLGHYLTRRGAALPETTPKDDGRNDDVIDGEIVPSVEEQAEAAEKELRAFAAQVGLPDIDADFEGAKGLPLAQATAEQVHGFLAELRGSAA